MLDVAVIGGGLCGLATARALLSSGGRAMVTLYDQGVLAPVGFSRTASAVAGGLLHPLTPKLKVAWEGAAALSQADELIRVAEGAAGTSVIASSSVLRPAMDQPAGAVVAVQTAVASLQ